MKNRGLTTRVKNAFSGVRHAWCGERSFRTQAGMGLIMSVAAVPARDRRSILGRLVGMTCFLDQMNKRHLAMC